MSEPGSTTGARVRQSPGKGLTSWLLGNAGPMAVVQLLGAGAVFVLHVLVARLLGTESYGLFAHVVAISGLFSILAPLGWNNAIVRFISQYRHADETALLRGVWIACQSTTFLIAGIISLIFIIIGIWAPIRTPLATSLIYSAALIPLMAFLEIARRALQGFGKFTRSLIPENVLVPSIGILCLAALYATGFGRAFLSSYLVIAAGAAGYALWLTNRSFANVEKRAPEFRTRSWMSVALPMLGSSIGYLVLNRLDLTVLGLLVSMDDVGEYAAAKRLVMLGAFVLAVLNSVVAPSLAAAHHDGAHTEFRRLVSRVRLLSCAVGFPIFLMLMIFAGPFLALFSIDGAGAQLVLRILALGQMVNVATGPVGIAMAMSSQEKTQAVICGITAVLAICVIPQAVVHGGLIGAAIVTSSSIALQNLTMLYFLTKFNRRMQGFPDRSSDRPPDSDRTNLESDS